MSGVLFGYQIIAKTAAFIRKVVKYYAASLLMVHKFENNLKSIADAMVFCIISSHIELFGKPLWRCCCCCCCCYLFAKPAYLQEFEHGLRQRVYLPPFLYDVGVLTFLLHYIYDCLMSVMNLSAAFCISNGSWGLWAPPFSQTRWGRPTRKPKISLKPPKALCLCECRLYSLMSSMIALNNSRW